MKGKCPTSLDGQQLIYFTVDNPYVVDAMGLIIAQMVKMRETVITGTGQLIMIPRMMIQVLLFPSYMILATHSYSTCSMGVSGSF